MKIQNGFSLKPLTADAQAERRDGQIKDAAKMYETHFLNEMVKAMRSTVGQEDGLIKRGFGEKIFSEQLDQKYVDGWANKGGIGLADMIYTQIKERYGSKQNGGAAPQPKMLPIAPKKNVQGLGSPESIQMKMIESGSGKLGYRFEVPEANGGEFEVQAPMAGRVVQSEELNEGWNSVRLDHGQGVVSDLTFPGRVTDFAPGSQIEAGQKLGFLDSSRPALAWNLDWT